MANSVTFEGGCLCENVRYRISVEPIDAGYCHCRICQRSSGAPVLAWISVPVNEFSYLKEAPAVYASSPKAVREFCGQCGTQILFRKHGADEVDINLATLDDPEVIQPRIHTWTDSRISWFDTADDLKRYPDGGPGPSAS